MKTLFTLIFGLICCLNVIARPADTLEIYSPSMDRTLPVTVVVPTTYHEHTQSLPVVYLLHGAWGNHGSWLVQMPDKGIIQCLSDSHNVIFVMPSGDPFSFYIDSPWNDQSQFETHIVGEVVPFIDTLYRTLARKSGRAISGLSMGGHGALYLSARNPQYFAAAGSMSGAVDLDMGNWDIPEENAKAFLAQMGRELGQDTLDAGFLASHSVTNQADLMKENGMPLIIDCGVDDFLIGANRTLNSMLMEYGVDHDYIERPGAHTWPYWENALIYQVLFFSEVFRKANE